MPAACLVLVRSMLGTAARVVHWAVVQKLPPVQGLTAGALFLPPPPVLLPPAPALQAQWATEGLPTDALSIENGAIVCSSTSRWPLLIDPQLQARAQLPLLPAAGSRRLPSTACLPCSSQTDLSTFHRTVLPLNSHDQPIHASPPPPPPPPPALVCVQGIKWVLKREEPNGLRILQQSAPKYIDTVRLGGSCPLQGEGGGVL